MDPLFLKVSREKELPILASVSMTTTITEATLGGKVCFGLQFTVHH